MARGASFNIGLMLLLAGWLSGGTAQAAERSACPSPLDCLANAMDGHWASLGHALDSAAANRREARTLLVWARSQNLPAERLKKFEDNAALVEDNWQAVLDMVRAATSPAMQEHYTQRLMRAGERVVEAHRHLVDEAKLLARMEKAAFGRSWKAAADECADLVLESERARVDLIIHSFDALAATDAVLLDRELKYVYEGQQLERMRRLPVAFEGLYSVVTTPGKTRWAKEESGKLNAAAEAAYGALEVSLSVSKLFTKSTIYTSQAVAAFNLGMDAFTYFNLSSRLGKMETLTQRLQESEAPWKIRVEAAKQTVRQLEREKVMAESNNYAQQRLADKLAAVEREATAQ